MNVSFFAGSNQPSVIPFAHNGSPNTPEIEVLTPSEIVAIAGGPQIQNNPEG